jgi:4-hydroxy-3-methylbut-2-en-1-yl diphosphate reductase
VSTHLIDGPGDIDMAWFSSSPEETVLVTAGASAPEALVQRCVNLLQDRFAALVETRMVCEEKLRFTLPKL